MYRKLGRNGERDVEREGGTDGETAGKRDRQINKETDQVADG